ncbi:HEAT repeat domain-containing protein [Saliphagus sp. LR7]|uniref:HEAT repeat domain-containing protein n=1 Tax=Saliphagus sp. LR7 TaxID=2282654 RepID=UPI000DF7425E|nr:HEAT repeat domain-containing protein [Saliphagus sp. LR7]
MNALGSAFVAIVAATAVVGALALVVSILLARFDRRRERARPRLVEELFARLDRPDPNWSGWVGELSLTERFVLRRLLARYLRQLRGRERDRLVDLAEALGVGDRAVDLLASRTVTSRLRGLIWLTLLERDVPTERLRERCTDHPATRAGAARLLSVAGGPDAARDGTSLLLWSGEERLSVFGLDTLYRLNRRDATPLLAHADAEATWWSEGLVVQTLTVLAHCQATERADRFAWLPALLDHDSPQVRATALSAFARQGWRRELRERVDAERALADPEPAVRTAAYELFGKWGDGESVDWLRYGVYNDPDDRARLAAARTLRRVGGLESVTDGTGQPDEAVARTVAWAGAERRTPRRVATGWT